MSVPETQYAKSGPYHIAYQVFGDGSFDLVMIPGFMSHLEMWWEQPIAARGLRRLASFARVIIFDRGEQQLKGVAGSWRLFAVES